MKKEPFRLISDRDHAISRNRFGYNRFDSMALFMKNYGIYIEIREMRCSLLLDVRFAVILLIQSWYLLLASLADSNTRLIIK